MIKSDKWGDFSIKICIQGDCNLLRGQTLSVSDHKEPTGDGKGQLRNNPDKQWNYPPPRSSGERMVKRVCSR